MPKDKREAEIYYRFRLKDVSELYAFYLGVVCLIPIVDAIEFNSKRTLFFFLALVYTVVITAIRIVSHCLRDRYPGLYNGHILLFHILGQVRYSVVAYHKFTQVEESMQKEMAGVVFKTAQEQMTAAMFAHIVFLAPTFTNCMITMVSFVVTESFLLQTLMSPGDEEYIRNLFSPVIWGIGGFMGSHILMHREIKRHITDRMSSLKWQQMVAILDS